MDEVRQYLQHQLILFPSLAALLAEHCVQEVCQELYYGNLLDY